MRAFVDSSTLLKRYVEEPGSNELESLLKDIDEIVISPVTMLEMMSAISRRNREKDIKNEDYAYLKDIIEREGQGYSRVAYDEALETKSLEMIRKYPLKTLDSIQLASAILSGCRMVLTSDKKLARHAKSEKIRTKVVE